MDNREETELVVVPLDEDVRDYFAGLPHVEAIYRSIDEGVITFWVLTDNKAYDDALMDTLLSQEEVIMNRHSQSKVAFRYIPSSLTSSPVELVGRHGVSIFQR